MFTQQSPTWWSPGPLGSHNNHPPGNLLVLWVHTTITRLVISWSFGITQHSTAWWSPGPSCSHYNHPPSDLLVLWVHTTITPWWYVGPEGSHYNYPPGDLLVLWVHTTITPLVICWSWGFTLQSPAWWSPGPLGSHNNHPPGDLLVHRVDTIITRLVISWIFGFTQNEVARLFTWNLIKVHMLGCCCVENHIIFACRSNTKLGVTYVTKHMWQSSVPSTYSVQIGDPHLEIFLNISSLKATLPSSSMVSSSLVPYW